MLNGLQAAARALSTNGTHPAVMAVSGVVILAIEVIKFAQDQEKALQRELNSLEATVEKYKDYRQLRGEQRREFLGAMNRIIDTVDVASRLLPQIAEGQVTRLEKQRSVLSHSIDFIVRIRSEHDAARRLEGELASCEKLATLTQADVPEDALEVFREQLKRARELILEAAKEE